MVPRFIADFSKITAPLTQLTRKAEKWHWGEKEESAFKELKQRLSSAPVLACPNFDQAFCLQTDASTDGLGAVLTQTHDGTERVIAYASRTLNSAERNYSATELECLAVVWGIRRMRDYLEGYRFTVLTDHQSLKWLQRLDAPTGRLGRWVLELQQYDFDIQYRKGSLNTVADALSRQPELQAVTVKCPWYEGMKKTSNSGPKQIPRLCPTTKPALAPHIARSRLPRSRPGATMETLCAQRPTRRNPPPTPRRPIRGPFRHSENDHPNRPTLLLAGDVPRNHPVRTGLPKLPSA